MIDIGLLPTDAESERLVLATLMTDGDAIAGSLPILEREDFGIEKHRRIFSAIEEIWRGGGVPDRVAVARQLQAIKQLESVDGVGYLVDLEVGMPQLFNIEGYLSRLRDLNTRRRLLKQIDALADQVSDQSNSIESIAAVIQEAHKVAIESRRDDDGLMTLGEYIAQYPGGYAGFMAPEKEQPIPTPWNALSEILAGGWRPGELTVIAARPGYGKSAAGGQIAYIAAVSGAYCDVFSLEMRNREIWFRMFAGLSKVPLQRFRRGQCSSEERQRVAGSVQHLSEVKTLRISDRSHRTIQAIENILRKRKARRKLDLVIVDYLQLMQMAKRPRSRVEEVTEITRSLKLMCMEMGFALIVLAQINRESVQDSREPDLHDLRESGSTEQDADAVMFLYQKPSDKALAIARRTACPTQILVKKQRNGSVGKVHCEFDGRFVRLEETQPEASCE